MIKKEYQNFLLFVLSDVYGDVKTGKTILFQKQNPSHWNDSTKTCKNSYRET
jgi:hypothetical protein